jgi:hypothetical protein
MKTDLSIKNFDPYKSFHNVKESDYVYLRDSNDLEIMDTEIFWPIGKAAYDHLVHISEMEEEAEITPNEYITDRANFVSDCVDSFLGILIEKNTTLEFPLPTGALVGEELEAWLDGLEPLSRLEILIDLFDSNEMVGKKVILYHRSGIYALACLVEMDFIADLAPITTESNAQWVGLCCNWREKMNIEIAVKNTVSERSSSAAKKRHAETNSMKDEALAIYNKAPDSYKSVAEAARKLSRVVPVTTRTIEKWIRERKR